MTIDFLITTFNKNKDEIMDLINNLDFDGNVIIGNQVKNESDVERYSITDSNKTITVYNHFSIGVSKNRNFLVNKSLSDYVMFMDDDGVFVKNCVQIVENVILSFKRPPDAIKFNVISLNPKRGIKLIRKTKKCKFRDVSSYGVWGLLVKRDFIRKQKVYFNENVGPGRKISSGEDVIYLHEISKKTRRFYLSTELVAYIKQDNTTWFNGFDTQYMINKGYNYRIMFNLFWFIPCIFSIIKHHRKDTRLSIIKKIHYSIIGSRIAKKEG